MNYELFIVSVVVLLIYICIYYKQYKEVEIVLVPEPETGPGVELILDHPDECVICLDPGVNYALPCTHKFHKECILKWFKKVREQNEAQVCPICRCNV